MHACRNNNVLQDREWVIVIDIRFFGKTTLTAL